MPRVETPSDGATAVVDRHPHGVRVYSVERTLNRDGDEIDRVCHCAHLGPCPDDDPFASACPRRRHSGETEIQG